MMVANLMSLFSAKVLRNFGSLMILQFGTYLLPLLLIPFLVRTLGLEVFGQWMFAMAFLIVARVCVSYGFDLTATRQVASTAVSPEQRSDLLSDVVTARLFVWSICLAILLALSALIPQIAEVRLLLFAASFILIGEALFPTWLFQGVEKMGVITQLRLGAKVVNLVLVVLLVRGPDQVLLVPIIEAGTLFVATIVALTVARRDLGIRFSRPVIARMSTQLKDGGPIFISNLAAQFYTTMNMIVLGLIIGPLAVASYAIAEKIYSALRGLLTPFVQATFPALARLHESSWESFSHTYRNLVYTLVAVLTVAGGVMFLAAGPLVWLIAGDTDQIAIDTLRIFSIAFPFALGSFLAPMLVIRKHHKSLMRITIIGGLIGLIAGPPLSMMLGAIGAAAAFLIVHVYNSVALLMANRADAGRYLDAETRV